MNIGAKIKRLRVTNGLTQEELANRAELTKGFISQIERNLNSPSINTLIDILQCLGTDLKAFFSDVEDRQVVFKKKDIFINVDERLKSSVEWIVPNAQKNRMEPIRLVLEPKGTTPKQQPHEGEEFGYVIKGSIQIHLGSEKYTARSGESFYYESSVVHHIENCGTGNAVLIWISSPPSF